MAWPQARHRRRRFVDGRDVHAPLPVGPVEILDDHGDRAAHGAAVAHAGDDLDAIVLDLLAPAAAVAALSARQVDVDVLGEHGQARGQVLDEDRQLRAVRLASGEHAQIAKAHTLLRITDSYTSSGATRSVHSSNARAA